MAVVVELQMLDTERVAAAAARCYAVRGDLVSQMPLRDVPGASAPPDVTAVVAAGARRIEIVLDDGDEPDHLIGTVYALAAAGWAVIVLTPGPVLGAAHTVLRGVPCHLQQWWIDDERVCFGSVELP